MATVDSTHRASAALAPTGGGSGGGSTPGSGPSYGSAMTHGTWGEVATGTTLASVDPKDDPALNPNYPGTAPWKQNTGQRGVLTLWTGGALADDDAPHGSLLLCGGGHNGYAGSEVYRVRVGTGVVSRITNPFPGPFNWPYEACIFPDGSPCISHTYFYTGYHKPSRSFALLHGEKDGVISGGGIYAIGHFLDIDTGVWRHTPLNPLIPAGFKAGGKSCYDSVNDCFWILGAQSSTTQGQWWISKLYDVTVPNGDGTYGKWANFPQSGLGGIDGGMLFIESDELIVYSNFRSGANQMYGIKITNGVPGDRVLLTQGGSPPTRASASAWDWAPAIDSIIYWRDGADVYKITKPATWNTGSWDWSKLTVPGNTLAPVAPANGPYSKFKVATYSDMTLGFTVVDIAQKPLAFRIA